MSRAIKLVRSEIKNANHGYLHGFRLRIDVAEAIDMDANVFVYCRHPADPKTGLVLDEFMTVASFPDMAEYPTNDPNPELGLQYFRKSYVELDVRSTRDYHDIWQLLVAQVCHLRSALDRADHLVEAESVWCTDQSDLPVSDTSEVSGASDVSEGH